MKLTKRILCLLLALAMTFALCACGNSADQDDTAQTTTTTNEMGGNLEGEDNFNDGMFTEW